MLVLWLGLDTTKEIHLVFGDLFLMLFSLEVLRGALKFTAEERNLKKEEIKS